MSSSSSAPPSSSSSSSPATAAAAASAAAKATTVEVKENSSFMQFPNQNEVFYNPVQVLNRDLSITVIRQFGETMVREREEKFLKKKLRKEWLADDNNGFVDSSGNRNPKKGVKQPNFLDQASQQLKGTDWADWVLKEDEARRQWRDRMKEAQASGADVSAIVKEKPPPGLKILDCLAASGLRSMRYFKEIKNVDLITVNDLDPSAVELAENNIKLNEVDDRVVKTRVGDGTMLCYEAREGVENVRADAAGRSVVDPNLKVSGNYDVIDLDPYGSAAPFTDAAVQAIADGGLLCLTSTDMAVLSGNHAGKVPLAATRSLHILIFCSSLSHTHAHQPNPTQPKMFFAQTRHLLRKVPLFSNRQGRLPSRDGSPYPASLHRKSVQQVREDH